MDASSTLWSPHSQLSTSSLLYSISLQRLVNGLHPSHLLPKGLPMNDQNADTNETTANPPSYTAKSMLSDISDKLTPDDFLFLLDVAVEIEKARTKFPGTEIMTNAFSEEAGELVKAVLDEPREKVRKEAVQAACMACRLATEGDESVVNWRKNRGLDSLV